MAGITPDEQHEYVRAVVTRDMGWQDRANCREAGPQVVDLFCCLEDDVYVKREGVPVRVDKPRRREMVFTGLSMQQYIVDAFCVTCPVQWECARHALEFETDEKRSTGAWSMTRRDLRWLAKQPDAISIVDEARYAGTPMSVQVAVKRKDTRKRTAV